MEARKEKGSVKLRKEPKIMERKVFPLPDHPHRGRQYIVVELPNPMSVWHLLLDEEKMKPLVGFNKPPISAKQVLDEFAKEYGEDNVYQFMTQGYSLVNV